MSRISDILGKIDAKSAEEKQASGTLNPTRFETDLVSAINGETSINKYQSLRARDIAERCVFQMNQKFGKIVSAEQSSKETSNGASVLSPLYKKFMCAEGGRCNGDPKSDIIIVSQMSGIVQASLKKEGAAQIASAQHGEINAVLSAALGKDKPFVGKIRNILSSVLSKESYYDIRNAYALKSGGSPEDFDSLLANITGLRTRAANPSYDEIKRFNDFLVSIGIKDKLTSEIREYVGSTPSRKAIFREFASGENRYIKSQSKRVADWFIVWSESGKITAKEIDEFINSNLGSFRMNIRDRGNESGGSLRIDIRESNDFIELERILHSDFDNYCLTEGVLDTTVNLIRTAGKAVASLYKSFVEAIKSTLSFIAALVSSGIQTLLEFFGLETTELSYSW